MARQKQTDRKRPKGGASASGGDSAAPPSAKPARASGKRKAEEMSEDRPEVEIEEDMETMEEEAKAGRMTKEENNRYSRLMQQANKKQRKQLKKMYRAGASLEQMIQMAEQAEAEVVEPVLSTAAAEHLQKHVVTRNRMVSLLEQVLKPVGEVSRLSLLTELMTVEHLPIFSGLIAEFHDAYALLPEQRLPLKNKLSAKYLGTARRVVLLRHRSAYIGFIVLAVHSHDRSGGRAAPPLIIHALHITAGYLDRGVGPAALHLLVTLALGVRADGLRFNQMIEQDVHPEMVERWRQWGLRVEPRPIGTRRALRGAGDTQDDDDDDEMPPPQKLFGIKLPKEDLQRLHDAYTQAQLARCM